MRAWVKSLLVAVMAIVAMPALAQETYQEGVHYDLITPNIQTGISDRVVVTEFFSYGCGHCFNFEHIGLTAGLAGVDSVFSVHHERWCAVDSSASHTSICLPNHAVNTERVECLIKFSGIDTVVNKDGSKCFGSSQALTL